jgi:hypothetical protein
LRRQASKTTRHVNFTTTLTENKSGEERFRRINLRH